MELNAFKVQVQTEPKNIDFLNKVFEAYDNLGVVTTIDPKAGILIIRGFGKISVVRRILRGLPFSVETLSEA
ncbi:MAG: DUF4911 domain-containing protein [Clostridiales bacterium]